VPRCQILGGVDDPTSVGDIEDNEELLPDEDAEPPAPTYRVTIRSHGLMLTDWAPWLAGNGPSTNLLREREEAGVAIADLTLVGDCDREIAVRFYADGGDRASAERAILRWARAVGYRRVWLSNRLEELKPSPEQIGTAQVRCPSCGVVWRDSSPEFWLVVRDQGAFPKWCAICGRELPQWSVRPSGTRRRGGSASSGSTDGWGPTREPTDSRQRKA
jgi:hypothetical protein